MVEAKWGRYASNDPLDLGEALWLAHWALPAKERWAAALSERSALALEEMWQAGGSNHLNLVHPHIGRISCAWCTR